MTAEPIRKRRVDLVDVAAAIGFVLIMVGLSLFSIPLALIVGGALILIVSLVIAWYRSEGTPL